MFGKVDDELARLFIVFVGDAYQNLLNPDILAFGGELDGENFPGRCGGKPVCAFLDELKKNLLLVESNGGHEWRDVKCVAKVEVEQRIGEELAGDIAHWVI